MMMLRLPRAFISLSASRLVQMFLPSLSPDFRDRNEKYIRDGKECARRLTMRRQATLHLIEELNRRMDALSEEAMAPSSEEDKSSTNSSKSDQLAEFCDLTEKHRQLLSRLKHLDNQLRVVKHKYGNAACKEYTQYEGIQDWAKRRLEKYSHFCDAISAASVFGAGITYTTIFNAPSASVSLIAWSFSLFDIAFIISICVRTTLMWASRLPLLKRSFASTLYWDIAITTAVVLAFMSGAAAICILNITVLNLAITGTVPPHSQDSSPDTSSPISRNSLLPSVMLGIISLAGALFTGVVLLLLSWWAAGFRRGQVVDEELVGSLPFNTDEYFV